MHRKLNDRQVREICESTKTSEELSIKYGVSQGYIVNLWKGRYRGDGSKIKRLVGYNRKLTDEQVEEADRLYRSGEWTYKALGERYGVSLKTISGRLYRRWGVRA